MDLIQNKNVPNNAIQPQECNTCMLQGGLLASVFILMPYRGFQY